MTAKRISIAVVCVLLLAGVAAADDGADCSDVRNQRDDMHAVAYADQVLTASAAQVSTLHAYPGHNGGVKVQGWDRGDFVIHVCKTAWADSEEEAKSIVSQIDGSLRGGDLDAHGPEHEQWTVFFVINAPRAAGMKLETENGPVSLRDTTGTVEIRAQNGPISIKNCSGDVNATAQNGPISFRGQGGSLKLKTQNGPIDVQLAGSSWQGSGLDASTVNGPLTLELPQDYGSGVVIQTTGRSPFSCRAQGCENARANFQDELKSIQLGSGNATVHASTVNGPVSIRNRRSDL